MHNRAEPPRNTPNATIHVNVPTAAHSQFYCFEVQYATLARYSIQYSLQGKVAKKFVTGFKLQEFALPGPAQACQRFSATA